MRNCFSDALHSALGKWNTKTANTIIAEISTFPTILKEMPSTSDAYHLPTDRHAKLCRHWLPGWYGVESGINENGVVITMNAGDSNITLAGNGPFHLDRGSTYMIDENNSIRITSINDYCL